ncbi:MAG: hypoxanthine phosphoribosyltransferase [Anaerolineales bacterium]|nr:hypoxanthine phosphoribosyltransferase [Anaerolineales bacterium]
MGDIYPDLARVLISEEKLQERVVELADQITRDYSDSDDLYMIGILKGAFIFLADLARKLEVPHIVDFMALSSYGQTTTTTGAVRILMDLREPIEDRNILLIEDIVDSGHTLSYLYKTLLGRRPATLRTCVLLQKERDALDVPIDYLGFSIPDVWVVGYGLDFADKHRTLPFIAELKPEAYEGT